MVVKNPKTNIFNISNVTFVQQPLWNNELFMNQGKQLYFLTKIRNGILQIKDLVKADMNS